MATDDSKTEFVRELTNSQNRLFAYIRSLVIHPETAQDVLQETNVVLWRKSDEYAPGTNFGAWACRVAFYQVLAFRRDRARDRHLFDDRLLGTLAEKAEVQGADLAGRQQALRRCLDELQPRQRDVIRLRYEPGGSLQAIAKAQGRTVRAVESALYRIRHALFDCINRRLAGDVAQ